MLRIYSLGRPVVKGWFIGFIIGLTTVICGLQPVAAQPHKSPISSSIPVKQVAQIWAQLTPNQRHYVDLLATDFFNQSLSLEEKRRLIKDSQGNPIGVIAAFPMLSDHQKSPFRRYALEQLDLGPLGIPSRQNQKEI